jgi:CheY-like chemotaxis protein
MTAEFAINPAPLDQRLHDTKAFHPIPAARRLQVLVAEDDELNQDVIQQQLERRGHSVRVVSNGRKALAALAEGTFDLLLLDMRMPEMDGFQVSKHLRARERESGGCSRLPVIALTAMATKRDRERCLEAGMDEYLSKPVQPADLYSTIDRVIALRSVPGRAVARSPAGSMGEAPAEPWLAGRLAPSDLQLRLERPTSTGIHCTFSVPCPPEFPPVLEAIQPRTLFDPAGRIVSRLRTEATMLLQQRRMLHDRRPESNRQPPRPPARACAGRPGAVGHSSPPSRSPGDGMGGLSLGRGTVRGGNVVFWSARPVDSVPDPTGVDRGPR